MGKKIIIISSTESFTVRGLEMKLKGIGADPAYLPPKLQSIELEGIEGDLFILYTDEGIATHSDVLVFLKDHCTEADKKIIIVGSKAEYEAVKNFLSIGCIQSFYERPLDMENFLNDVEDYLQKNSDQAKRKSILIVDDDVSYMTIIMEWLKDRYRVSVANSGMQAITWLAKNHADLILLDYEMPITSGPQVLEMIRSDAPTADIPVMFLTGKGDKESIMKVLSLKPAGYLLKTIDKKGLLENIGNFFLSEVSKKLLSEVSGQKS